MERFRLIRPFLRMLSFLFFGALACNLSEQPEPGPSVETQVAGTLTALPSDTPAPEAPSETPLPALGAVSGQVCYPSEPPVPPINIYFHETDSGVETLYEHSDGSSEYSLELEPGTYVAYAWRVDSDLAGAYTYAVPCGLDQSCTDHDLAVFEVDPGAATEDIDICDWYGGPESVPTPIAGLPWLQELAFQPTVTATAPPNGVSLNCDGSYQRVRIVDQGASGKTVAVDNWDGSGWVNVWSVSSGDPMLKQLTDDAGWYQFGDCEKLVVVPFQHSNPQLWFELGIYAWNGAGMSSVYAREGYYGEWQKVGDLIRFRYASKLGSVNNGPLGPCEWTTFEHTWNGGAFAQTGSVVEPVANCTPIATPTP